MSAGIVLAALVVAGGAAQPPDDLWAQCDGFASEVQIAACSRIVGNADFDERSHAAAYLNRGQAYFEFGEDSRALSDFSRAAVLRPDSAYAHRRRGELLSIRGYTEEATAELDRAIDLEPDNAYALLARAEHRRGIGDMPGARQDLTDAIAVDSSIADLYAERGSLALETGNAAQAVADFARVIELDPEEPLALLDLAQGYYALGRAADAFKALQAYLDRADPHEERLALRWLVRSE